MHSRPEQVVDSCSCVSAFAFPPTQYCCASNPWRVGTNVTRDSELLEYDGVSDWFTRINVCALYDMST